MTTVIRKLTADGLQPVDYTAASLTGAAQYEPADGVYTITNTYNVTQVLKFDAHLNRMEDSARRVGMPLKLDRPKLRAALREMIMAADFGDVRFRITAGHDAPQTLILTLEPYTPPPATLYADGVRVVTVRNYARQNPDAKTTDWMHTRESITATLETGIYDGILLDAANNLLEGLSTNFYAILDGELRTAGSGVLAGIAQQIVFEVAVGLLPIVKVAPNLADVPRIAEAFITSSSRGIIPVIEIDGKPVQSGTPGTWTRTLQTAYQAWVAAHLEEL